MKYCICANLSKILLRSVQISLPLLLSFERASYNFVQLHLDTKMQPVDLLVVGAGPIGLCTAVGALHRGAKHILIVDQTHSFRPVGQYIDLLPNAINSLHFLCPRILDKLEPFLRTQTAGKLSKFVTDVDGEFVTDTKQDVQFDKRLATVSWRQLQILLLGLLPDNIVVLNHQLVDVRQEGEFAVAEFVVGRRRANKFKNWEGDDKPEAGDDKSEAGDDLGDTLTPFTDVGVAEDGGRRVTCCARVVVGADGINSAARRSVYRDEGIAERYATAVYTGLVRILLMGHTKLEERDERFLAEKHVKPDTINVITCKESDVTCESIRLMLSKSTNKKFSFSWLTMIFAALDEEQLSVYSPYEVFYAALEEQSRRGFPQEIIRLQQELWDDSAFDNIVRPMFVVPATHPMPFERLNTSEQVDYPEGFRRPWYHRRLVLAGDAKHAAPPFLAQGTAMGIEDACVLVSGLNAAGVWEEGKEVSEEQLEKTFKAYVKDRMERVCMFQKHTMNRVSEYDEETARNVRGKLWSFKPEAVM